MKFSALCVAVLFASEVALSGELAPFGIDKRIPWTNSRVVGSPEPSPPYRVKRVFPKLNFKWPLAVTHLRGTNDLLVIEHHGGYTGPAKFLRFKSDPDTDKTELFLTMDRIAYGVAFHPNFAQNGYIFVGSNGPDDTDKKMDRISRFTVDLATCRCDPKSELVILEWPSNGHNGADVAFGPDGMLYISTGDGTSDSDTNLTGQGVNDLLATMIRIDVDRQDAGKNYSVPKDNPFVNTPGACGEIWAYGFRNPWRITFDQEKGHLWVAQNGQDLWEQAYVVTRGGNYGWSIYEGSHPFQLQRQRGAEPIQFPVVEHHHSEARSLTGGIVYYGKKLPELRGVYIYGDYSTGKVWGVRYNGKRATWHQELADTILQISGFGVDHFGELLIVDHEGGLYELEPTPKEKNQSKFPHKLSETGLFTSVKGHEVSPALIPYSVNSPLWSDGAAKERFIALPAISQIDFTTNRGWNCPEGTVLVKTFSLETSSGKMRRIETRLLTKQQNEWVGYSYIWNDAQDEATLVDKKGLDKTYRVAGSKSQTWHFPSRTECMVCHSRAANFVLGLTELQMNKVHQYGSVAAEQISTFEHLGIFRVHPADNLQEARSRVNRQADVFMKILRGESLASSELKSNFLVPVENSLRALSFGLQALENDLRNRKDITYNTRLPKTPAEYRRLADPYDATKSLDARARSYLHANCAICHVEAGGGNSQIDLEFTTSRDKTKMFDIKPLHDSFGIPDARLIAPGAPDRSVLLQRIMRRGTSQMPPLASSVVDKEAAELLREWIEQMK